VCGFAGIYLRSPGGLSSMTGGILNKSLHHRGPDDAGTYRSEDGRVLLVSQRLAIIDLSSAGHMPMANADGTVWITYNGEIYNFQSLREDLARRGHTFVSHTDTEVLLHLYQEFGEDCVQHLRGMFAFAIWDTRRAELFAARDRLGIKPLYYSINDKGVCFASEIKALLAAGLVVPEPNWAALGSYLQLGSVPAPHTAVLNVFCLPPACILRIRSGRASVERYWELAFGGGEQDEARAVRRTRELLEEAVQLHLISDAPLGVFLSGGMDSNTIAALAAPLVPHKLTTLSVVFQELEFSEALLARQMAQKLGTEHIELEVTSAHVTAAMNSFIGALDQPTVDGVNSYFVCEMTRQVGLKVALSGLGGDEVFGGYPSFHQVPLLARSVQLARLLPGHRQLARQLVHLSGSRYTTRALDAVSTPLPSWTAAYVAVREIFGPSDVPPYLRGPAAEAFRLLVPWRDFGESRGDWSSARTPFDRVSALELQRYMPNQLLRDTDVFSMAHSIEVRVPFLDHILVQYVASLSASMKLGTRKRLLRQAMQDVLPSNITSSRKQGFALPWRPWLEGPLGNEIQARLREAYPQVDDVINPTEVERIWQRFRQGKASWSQVWTLTILVLWVARLRMARF